MFRRSNSKLPSSNVNLLLVLFGVTISPLGVSHLVVKFASTGNTPHDRNVESERGVNSVGITTSSRCENMIISKKNRSYNLTDFNWSIFMNTGTDMAQLLWTQQAGLCLYMYIRSTTWHWTGILRITMVDCRLH